MTFVIAVGCADPEINADTSWMRRQLDTAVVGCKTNSRQWTLRCVDNHWSNNHNLTCIPGGLSPLHGHFSPRRTDA